MRKEHGAQRGSGAKSVVVAKLMGDVDDKRLNEELQTCKHFWWTQIETGRHRVYNFAMQTLEPKYLLEKLEVVFYSLKCAAKLNKPFNFELKNKKKREL